MNDFKNVYQPRTNLVEDKTEELLAGSHGILDRRTTSFQLLNVHGVNDIRQTEMHVTELFVPEPSLFEVKISTKMLKGYKSPSRDQIPAQLNPVGGNTYSSEIYKESIREPTYKKGDKTDCSNSTAVSVLLATRTISFIIPISSLTLFVDEIIGDHQFEFRRNILTTDQYCLFVRYWRKIRNIMEYISCL
jgi:hypothetical protein